MMLDYQKDPRPDLEGDHVLWVALLTTAKEQGDEELFGALHCLRCLGAALEEDRDFGLLIRSGACDPTEYEEYRTQHLASRKAEVVRALKAATRMVPQAQKDTLRARIASRVKAVEGKALDLGWSEQDIWAETYWKDPSDGRRRESLYIALLSTSKTMGNAEVGEITPESAEIVLPTRGGKRASLRLYRISPAVRQQGQAAG